MDRPRGLDEDRLGERRRIGGHQDAQGLALAREIAQDAVHAGATVIDHAERRTASQQLDAQTRVRSPHAQPAHDAKLPAFAVHEMDAEGWQLGIVRRLRMWAAHAGRCWRQSAGRCD